MSFLLFVILLSHLLHAATNIGFKTLSGDKLIVGVISNQANGFEIRRMMTEMAEIKRSFETFLNGRPFYASPKRLMKQVTRLDGSSSFLYEFNSCGFGSFIKINAQNYDTLSTLATFFDSIILITASELEMEMSETFEYQPTKVITASLVDEGRDQADLSMTLVDESDSETAIDKRYFRISLSDNSNSCLLS